MMGRWYYRVTIDLDDKAYPLGCYASKHEAWKAAKRTGKRYTIEEIFNRKNNDVKE